MKLNTLSQLSLAALLSVGTIGCAGLEAKSTAAEPTYSDCQITQGARLNEAAGDLTGKIRAGTCRNFEEAFHNLMAAGLEDPDQGNREIMARFITSAQDQNLVSRKQAQETFSRHFHSTFVSLPDTFQTCSSLADKAGLFKAMKEELADKETSYLHVLNEPDAYKEVYRQYEDVVLVIEAADLACKGQVAGR